ncbi:proline dehydrogenase [Sporothrix eucalyptigena]
MTKLNGGTLVPVLAQCIMRANRGRRDVDVVCRAAAYSSIARKITASTVPDGTLPSSESDTAAAKSGPQPPLARMRTAVLLRSVVLTSIMSSPWLLRPCLGILRRVVEASSASTSSASSARARKSLLFDLDRNPVLRKLLQMTVYSHFCAGSNTQQVQETVRQTKAAGFQGVILGYGKEIVMDNDGSGDSYEPAGAVSPDDAAQLERRKLQVMEAWKQGTLQTLTMISPGDFLAIKFTGAGPLAVDALRAGEPMPPALAEAMHDICTATAARGARLWLDAEQQVLQHTIDAWTIDLMRRYNRQPRPVVYNTIQAYLKGARANAARHLRLAADEGWALGIKLVRGAYIAHETRSLIHATQAATDASYNDIAASLIAKRVPAAAVGESSTMAAYPRVGLFLATHNAESVRHALQAYRARVLAGQPTVHLECGQLQGMADEVSYGLVRQHEAAAAQHQAQTVPAAFKCLTWGSLAECLHFLYRRSIENQGAVVRTRHMANALREELWRRVRATGR